MHIISLLLVSNINTNHFKRGNIYVLESYAEEQNIYSGAECSCFPLMPLFLFSEVLLEAVFLSVDPYMRRVESGVIIVNALSNK